MRAECRGGRTPLHEAASKGYLAAACVLCAWGADPRDRTSSSPNAIADATGDAVEMLSVARRLTGGKAPELLASLQASSSSSPPPPSASSSSPAADGDELLASLLRACERRDRAEVGWLVAAGAPLEQDSRAVAFAAGQGMAETVAFLIAHHADFQSANGKQRRTPLATAAAAGAAGTCSVLLMNGATIPQRSNSNRKRHPLDLAPDGSSAAKVLQAYHASKK